MFVSGRFMRILVIRILVILLACIFSAAGFGAPCPAVLAADSIDLTVTQITIFPLEPAIGESVTITAAVKNQGEYRANSSYMTCYIDESVLDTRLVGPIEPGITATVTFAWIAAEGAHVIKTIADANNTIPETDETNNTATYSITTSAPDLVIESITWSPENPEQGDAVVFSIVIKNQGNIDSRYCSLNFYVDTGARGSQDVAAIKPGKTITKTYKWTMLEGSHNLKAVIDEHDSNKESHEGNNELTAALGTVPADLIVEKVAWAPLNPSKDDIVSFNVTVANAGAGRAGQSYLGYYIDDVFLNMIAVPVLEAGASCNVTFTWEATLEAHGIRAAADYYKMVNESNEENNILDASLLTLPPDLIITNVTWAPLEPAAGDDVTFSIYLKNQGGGRADPSRMIFSLDTKQPVYLDFPGIEAGAEAVMEVEWAAESGMHKINLKADYLLKVIESNDENNRYNTTFSVAAPDLLITKISYLPAKPALDETVTFNVTISNEGKGKAPGVMISYFIDDVSQSSAFVKPLDAGAAAVSTWKWKIGAGHHVFKAMLDYANELYETNEKNNTASIPIAPNMPDLSITNVTWSPAEIPAGQDIVFVIDIENLGGLTAEPSRLVYYVDNGVAGFNDINAVAAGEKVTQSFTWAASEGQHNISIVADSKDQITEIDELNNTVIVNIPPPDLVIKDITYTPEAALSGEKVIITASVMNERGSKTPESTAEFYIDEESIGSAILRGLEAGETGEVSLEWTAEPGNHIIKVTADINKSVMEINETNNDAETVFATTTPDLAVDNIFWLADSVSGGNDVSFTIVISNKGACASGAFSIEYSFDNAAPSRYTAASIPGCSTFELSISPILSEGQHTVTILLDTENDVSESDETNNQLVFPFSTIAADLIIRSITWSPMTAGIGDVITISAKIENTGQIAAGSTCFTLSIDGVEAGTFTSGEIDSGDTISADFTWTALEGEHTIEILADTAQSVTESNETNNLKSRVISFAKPEAAEKNLPIITTNATTGGGLLETWWWVFLLAGGALGLGVLYNTIRNMRQK